MAAPGKKAIDALGEKLFHVKGNLEDGHLVGFYVNRDLYVRSDAESV